MPGRLRVKLYFNRCVLEYILTKNFRYISENITENYNENNIILYYYIIICYNDNVG